MSTSTWIVCRSSVMTQCLEQQSLANTALTAMGEDCCDWCKFAAYYHINLSFIQYCHAAFQCHEKY